MIIKQICKYNRITIKLIAVHLKNIKAADFKQAKKKKINMECKLMNPKNGAL